MYILTGAAGNLLSSSGTARHLSVSLFDQQLQHQAFDPLNYFSPGAGASGAVFGIAGALIVLLKSTALAGAAGGIEEAAQVGNLLCRDQSRHWPCHQLGRRVVAHRNQHRQLGASGRCAVRTAVCRAHGATARQSASLFSACASDCRGHDRRHPCAVRVLYHHRDRVEVVAAGW